MTFNPNNKPKYKHEENLKYAIDSEYLISLPSDKEGIGSWSEQEVLDLIQDLEDWGQYMHQLIDYGMKKIPLTAISLYSNTEFKARKEVTDNYHHKIFETMTMVWAALWAFHENIIPEKYKKDLPLS